MSKGRYGDGSVSQRSDGRWRARLPYTDDHGTKKRAERITRTKAEAVAALRDMRRRAEDGGVVVEDAVTVEKYAERWITTTLAASPRKDSTKTAYRYLTRGIIIPALGSKRLRDLTPRDVEAFLLGITDKAPATAQKTHRALCLVIDAAVRDGLVRRNVARLVQSPRVPRTEARWFTDSEVARLREAARGHRLAGLVDFCAFTGVRISEALALRWSDVDDGKARITGSLTRGGQRDTTKTAAGVRVVPLAPEVVESLRARRKAQAAERLAAGMFWEDTDLVFATTVGTPTDSRNALRFLHDLESAAGVDRAGWHAFRHGAATRLLRSGVDVQVVQRVLGHSRVGVTLDVYGHLTDDESAAQVLGAMRGYGDPQSDPQSAQDTAGR